MTSEEKEKLKKEFCAEMESLSATSGGRVYAGVKSYSLLELAEEVRKETDFGMRMLKSFAQAQEYLKRAGTAPVRKNSAPKP